MPSVKVSTLLISDSSISYTSANHPLPSCILKLVASAFVKIVASTSNVAFSAAKLLYAGTIEMHITNAKNIAPNLRLIEIPPSFLIILNTS